jgi:TPR repeat protein
MEQHMKFSKTAMILDILALCGILNISIYQPSCAGIEYRACCVCDYEYRQSEIADLETEALNGSSIAAGKLTDFYGHCLYITTEARFWIQIGAENGDALEQNIFCSYMKNRPLDARDSQRAKFWCGPGPMARLIRPTETRQKKRRKPKENSGLKEDKSHYSLTEAQINKLQGEALAGSPEVALKLFFYHKYFSLNPEESLYWARISAQNGDPVGQYEYGVLLSMGSDPRSRQRANFWTERAVEALKKLTPDEK